MEWAVIISAAAAISGIVLGWIGRAKAAQSEIREETQESTVLRSDVDYIKRGIDEVRLEQKDQGRRFDALSERVTRVEESTKSAHRRIDRFEKGGLES